MAITELQIEKWKHEGDVTALVFGIRELEAKVQRLQTEKKQLKAEMDKWNMTTAMIEKDLTFEAENKWLKSQQPPCHRTCYHHQTHPCERCGRINGYLPSVWQALKD